MRFCVRISVTPSLGHIASAAVCVDGSNFGASDVLGFEKRQDCGQSWSDRGLVVAPHAAGAAGYGSERVGFGGERSALCEPVCDSCVDDGVMRNGAGGLHRGVVQHDVHWHWQRRGGFASHAGEDWDCGRAASRES